MTNSPAERRNAPRADADFPVQLSADAGAQPAVLQNISQTGLCCHFPDPLTEMTLMAIDLNLPEGAAKVKGVVVRCDKLRGMDPPTYEAAIYFTEMEPATRRAIDAYVSAKLESGD